MVYNWAKTHMKIVFCGGGTGGHFYPLIAIAESVHEKAREHRLITPRLYYLAPVPYDEQSLFAAEMIFIPVPAGKWRRYFSMKNYADLFVTLYGLFKALVTVYQIYPDVVISKGGFASVPVTLAARFWRIPVIVHESDSKPGRANLMAAKYAYRIAISFPGAAALFPKSAQAKIALTGIPIRRGLKGGTPDAARAQLGLDASVPTVLILGGSSGSARINEAVLSGLIDMVGSLNIIHQTGRAEFAEIERTAKVILADNPNASRYHVFDFLSLESLRNAGAAASVIVSRAGAGSIAELSMLQKPAILIPIPESVSHDQRTNAYTYARTGAAVVLEEQNLTPHLLASEAKRIAADQALSASMSRAGAAFMPADAADLIAEEAIRIGLSHEPQPVV